jgi:hypothetical protein
LVPRADGPGSLRALHPPVTEKQWGRPARELPATFAPRRVSIRWDDDPYLFPDPYQGWPAGPHGYTDAIDGLLRSKRIELRTGEDVTVGTLGRYTSASSRPTRSCSLAHSTFSQMLVSDSSSARHPCPLGLRPAS